MEKLPSKAEPADQNPESEAERKADEEHERLIVEKIVEISARSVANEKKKLDPKGTRRTEALEEKDPDHLR